MDALGLGRTVGCGVLAVLARQPIEPELCVYFAPLAWSGLAVFGLSLSCRRREQASLVGPALLMVVKEVAFTPHPNGLGVCLVLAAPARWPGPDA